jgi:hypothetical protein
MLQDTLDSMSDLDAFILEDGHSGFAESAQTEQTDQGLCGRSSSTRIRVTQMPGVKRSINRGINS